MPLEINKNLVRRQFEELINKKNLSIMDTDMAEDFVDHAAPPDSPKGLEGAKEWIRFLYKTIPDLHVTIENIVAEGDKVVVRNTWRGTHTNHFLGIAPTGKKFEFGGMVMWRIESGKIKERWASIDFEKLKAYLNS